MLITLLWPNTSQINKGSWSTSTQLIHPSNLLVGETISDSSMPFLDTIVSPQVDGTFTTSVYRKPTHSDLYLQLDSHHNSASKYSVINTFMHRVRAVFYTPQLLKEELHHLEVDKLAINEVLSKQEDKKKSTNKRQIQTAPHSEKRWHIVMIYYKDFVKVTKWFITSMEYKCISKEDKSWKISWCHKRTRTQY